MRALAVVACLAAFAVGAADQLITIPTARKLPLGTVRLDYLVETGTQRTRLGSLDYGLTTAFEIQATTERMPNVGTATGVDIEYNYISPLPGISPGLAFGIQDLTDVTVDRRRIYACSTFRESFQTLDGQVPADITIGAYLHGPSAIFVGVSIPFSTRFKLLFEHNGVRIASGFEFRLFPETGIRLINRGQDTLLGLTLTRKF